MGASDVARVAGETFDPELDGARLGRQLDRVKTLMLDGCWRTLREIVEGIEQAAPHLHGASEAGVSARLRDLRKAKHGGYLVDRRRARAARFSGLWEYRVSFQRNEPT